MNSSGQDDKREAPADLRAAIEVIEELRLQNSKLEEELVCHSALLESLEDGVLFVDADRRVRRFNAALRRTCPLRLEDVGRPLSEIAYVLDGHEDMLDDLQRVLQTGLPVERDTACIDGRLYLKRILPVRDSEGKINGALFTFTDVTESRGLQNRFEFALESAGLSWWEWKLPKGKIELFSKGDCFLGMGCLIARRDSEGWIAVVHPDDRDLVRRTLDECICGKTDAWFCEHRFATDDGKWLWVRNRGKVLQRDMNGLASRMMGTTQDINSLKTSLNEALNRQAVLEATDEISKVGAWEYDPATDQFFWSKQIFKILEIDERTEPAADLTFESMPPVDRIRLQNAFAAILEKGVPYDLKLRFTSANGKHLLCRSAARARYDDNGRIIRIVGIFQDITETTRIQHEMEAFFNLTPGFHATVGLDRIFKSWSPAWLDGLGYSEEELFETDLLEVVHEADRSAFAKTFEAAASGREVTDFETRIVSKSDQSPGCAAKEAWVSWNFSSDAALSLVFVSARCVTAQKEATAALAQAHLQAEHANRVKNDFLAVMSHELRTPLTPVIGFAEMLYEETGDREQKEMLKTIIDSGDHMLNLVDDILDLTKIGAGKCRLDLVDFSIADLVELKERRFSGLLKDSPVRLQTQIDWGDFKEEERPALHGDVEMIRLVLRNLLSNAVKYTNQGRIDLRASLINREEERVQIEFVVEDTGIGIPAAEQSRLFEAFTQVNGSMTRQFGGLGLGLAISKRMADLMDATITVESEQNKGSKFTFTVPLGYRLGSEESAEFGESGELTNDSIKNPDASRQVLVVEDNEANAFYMTKFLHLIGVQAAVAPSGEAALKRLSEESFGIVFLDLHMPGIGGLETLRRIRASERDAGLAHLPVYVLTADASLETKKQCEETGCSGFLKKPVLSAKLKEILENCFA